MAKSHRIEGDNMGEHKHEPHGKAACKQEISVECGCGHDHGHDHSHGDEKNLTLYLCRLSGALVLVALLSFIALPDWVHAVGFGVAYLLAGYDVLFLAIKNLLRGKLFDENFLMSLASVCAFCIGNMAEAAAVMIFYGIGELLQEKAVQRSKKNIAGLMDIRPDSANLQTVEGIRTVSPAQVGIGEIILVRAGERVPLDGEIVEGSSFLDMAALTGESLPRAVAPGERVLSGSINTSGLLRIRVDSTFENSTVSKILDMVQNASEKKAQSEKFITKFARIYTPVVVAIAALVALVPPLLGFGAFSRWLYSGISFLIISCPCALVISIPVGFFGGIGGAAKQGVLVKGGNFLEALSGADTIVFDKTGTLTEGRFCVSRIVPGDGFSAEEVVRLAALAEQYSTHPIAQSVLAYTGMPDTAAQVTERPGLGVVALAEGATILAGNQLLLALEGIEDLPDVQSKTAVYIAQNGRFAGLIEIDDALRQGTEQALFELRTLGLVRQYLLTGDHEQAAAQVADGLYLDGYTAGLLPDQKVAALEKIMEKSSGKTVFVGDGINDAPVLARADIGIAMGGIGSDAAIEAADIVIMTDDIARISAAIRTARRTRRIVQQNIIFSLGTKLVIMALALLDISSIWLAIVADVGVALLAVLNALRASKVK